MKLPEVKAEFGLPEEGKVMGLFLWDILTVNGRSRTVGLEFVTRWKTDSDTVVQHERKPPFDEVGQPLHAPWGHAIPRVCLS